jgi:hypothetical protein
MSVTGPIAHDLVASVAIDAAHPFNVVNIRGDLQVKPVPGKALGVLLTLFKGHTVPFGFINPHIRKPCPPGTVMTADTVVIGNLLHR